MKWAVVGASGRTGRHVVDLLLADGHDVVAIARRASGTLVPRPGLHIVDHDIRDSTGLHDHVAGGDRAVSAIGVGASRAPATAYSAGTQNLLAALDDDQPLAVVSAAPVGDRHQFPWMDRTVVMPVLDRFFGASYADMRQMESLLTASDRAWVSLRPPRLLDRPATGTWRLGLDKPPPRTRSITVGDLAAALIDAVNQPDLHGNAVYVTN